MDKYVHDEKEKLSSDNGRKHFDISVTVSMLKALFYKYFNLKKEQILADAFKFILNKH